LTSGSCSYHSGPAETGDGEIPSSVVHRALAALGRRIAKRHRDRSGNGTTIAPPRSDEERATWRWEASPLIGSLPIQAGSPSRVEFERNLLAVAKGSLFAGSPTRLVVVAFELHRRAALDARFGKVLGETMMVEVLRRLRVAGPRDALLAPTDDGRLLLAVRLDATANFRRTVGEWRLEAIGAPITVAGVYHLATLSAGVACLDEGECTTALVARAEQALALGRAEARDGVHFAV